MKVNYNLGRKIKSENDNPIDNIIYKIVTSIAPWLIKNNVTPNTITILGFILAMSGLFNLYHFNYKTFIVLLSLYILCDYLDGYIARSTYNTTKMGDTLDHSSDALTFIGLIVILFYKYDLIKHVEVILVYIIMLLCLSQYLKYTELVFDPNSKYPFTYGLAPKIINNKVHVRKSIKVPKYFKFFGFGIVYLYIFLSTYYLYYNKTK